MLTKKLKSDGDGWEANCDECSDSLDMPDAENWEAALAEMRKAEWRSIQKNGVWSHLCPTCYEAFLAKRPKTP